MLFLRGRAARRFDRHAGIAVDGIGSPPDVQAAHHGGGGDRVIFCLFAHELLPVFILFDVHSAGRRQTSSQRAG